MDFITFQDTLPKDIATKSGIYGIFCVPAKRWYVGQAVKLARRFRHHKSALIHNNHPNTELNRAVNEYSLNEFLFIVLKTCGESELNYYEAVIADEFKAKLRDGGFVLRIKDKLTPAYYVSEQSKLNSRKAAQARSKVKQSDIRVMRDMYLNGYVCWEIYDKYKSKITSQGQISIILNNKSWFDPDYKIQLETVTIPPINYEVRKLADDFLNKREYKLGALVHLYRFLQEPYHIDYYRVKEYYNQKFGVREPVFKLILNQETGIFYFSTQDAARTINRDPSYLTKMLKGKCPNKTKFVLA